MGPIQVSFFDSNEPQTLQNLPCGVPWLQESVHALGEKQSGLAKVLENAGVKEPHDIAGLKQTMQVKPVRFGVRHFNVRQLSNSWFSVICANLMAFWSCFCSEHGRLCCNIGEGVDPMPCTRVFGRAWGACSKMIAQSLCSRRALEFKTLTP